MRAFGLPANSRSWLVCAISLSLGPHGEAQNLQIASTRCPQECQLGKPVTITFSNLPAWTNSTHSPAKLEISLNGHLLKGLNPDLPAANADSLTFRFLRTKDNVDAWSDLLGSSSWWPTPMKLGVGLEGSLTLESETPISFRVIRSTGWLAAAVAFIAAMLVLFFILAKKTAMMRDPISDSNSGMLGSYSLARCQMAWWFFLVIGSYIYIAMITGDFDSVTEGTLVLIGISIGTGVSSAVVDTSKQNQRKSLVLERDSVSTDVSRLEQQIADPSRSNPADLKTVLEQKKSRLAEIAIALNNLPSSVGASDDFLTDILSDDRGVSFHRFQMAAWTLVLGIVFVYDVWTKLAMHDFSPTLLGLMGISGGTYVGFKIPDAPK